MYYSTLLHDIRNGKLCANILQDDVFSKLVALIAQINFGDFDAESLPDYSTLLLSRKEWTCEIQKAVETEHLKLDMLCPSECKIEFIKLVSEFSDYGVENFNVTSVCDKPKELILGVRYDGLRIYKADSNPDETRKLNNEKRLIQ